MLMGIVFQAKPSNTQKKILSQWIGAAKLIWNAKCSQWKYERCFCRKYLPIGTYASIDASYSQFKSKELTPFLYNVPSQILRNSASNWRDTMQNWKNKEHPQQGPAKLKKLKSEGSIWLTRELFNFEKQINGTINLFIGSKTNNIGILKLNYHTSDFKEPNSIRIKKRYGKYSVSFCYDDGLSEESLLSDKDNLKILSSYTEEMLNGCVVGVDRGVSRPVQCGEKVYDFTIEQKRKKRQKEKYIKRFQKRISRQKKCSNRRRKNLSKLSSAHKKISNIRNDFCHKTSYAMVNEPQFKVFVFEDLKTKSMTKRPKAKPNNSGGWDKNNAKSKAGLNKSILDKGWYKLEEYTKYKSRRACKSFFKVHANYTSQECADCGHIHPDNRKSQDKFICESCGYSENADRNASEVIKKRAIKLILHSGTELSKRGVLLDTGRGAKVRRDKPKANRAVAVKRQKRSEMSLDKVTEAFPL